MNIIDEIRRVLDIEVEALLAVAEHLTEDYTAAVEMIATCEGQVVVTGIGKSGIIAQKIAATLRSTGTPAVFLHAAEAVHGDLGVVRSNDVVLAVGKTGESTELNDLLRVLKKSEVPIIALTSDSASSMATLADIVLDLKVPREACPLNLAPTSSTTASLAVGDAIAVALMKMKDVSAEDFAKHHPGGQLGKRLLLTVKDVMHRDENNPVIGRERSVREMLVQITAFRVGAISVVDDDGKLSGLVTDFDIRRALESDRNFLDMTIPEMMNTSPETILEATPAVQALERMRHNDKPTAVLPVVDSNNVAVGMLHVHDLIAVGL